MIDKILPPSLSKIMKLVLQKYVPKNDIKEIAAVKCIIDFRITFYNIVGKDSRRYVQAGLELHKRLTRNTVAQVNSTLAGWLDGKKLRFVVEQDSRKSYINHYSKLLLAPPGEVSLL
jgi:hypothetical protein